MRRRRHRVDLQPPPPPPPGPNLCACATFIARRPRAPLHRWRPRPPQPHRRGAPASPRRPLRARQAVGLRWPRQQPLCRAAAGDGKKAVTLRPLLQRAMSSSWCTCASARGSAMTSSPGAPLRHQLPHLRLLPDGVHSMPELTVEMESELKATIISYHTPDPF